MKLWTRKRSDSGGARGGPPPDIISAKAADAVARLQRPWLIEAHFKEPHERSTIHHATRASRGHLFLTRVAGRLDAAGLRRRRAADVNTTTRRAAAASMSSRTGASPTRRGAGPTRSSSRTI